MDVDEAVEAVWAGFERNVRPAEVVRGQLDLEQAYAVQARIMQRQIDRGESIVGWKIGGNSNAARGLFGTLEPFSGFLLESGRYRSGSRFELSSLPGSAVLECELAFTFRTGLAGGDITRADVEAAIDTVAPALEIAAIGRVPGLDLAQIISDNVSQWGYVLGEAIAFSPGLDPGEVEVTARRNGTVAEHGLSRDVIDNQIDSIVWLVRNLAGRGLAIEPDHLVMSGSCLRPASVGNDEHWIADFSGIGQVEATFV